MELKNTTVIPGQQGSQTLVVLVHGWWGRLWLFSLKDVIKAIQEEMPHADLMVPEYPSGLFSNADPVEISIALSTAIETAVKVKAREEAYERVILIGFSLGTLIVRNAYVYARGQTQDTSNPDLAPKVEWPSLVNRVILLAGVNRGWSMSPRPPKVSWVFYVLYLLLYWITRYLPVGQLIRSYEQGSPFVANLRIQWQNVEQEKVPIPPTIQLLGTEEELVSLKDNADVQFCQNFIFFNVHNTGHLNAANFHEPVYGEYRKSVFVHALTESIADLEDTQDLLPVSKMGSQDPSTSATLGASKTDQEKEVTDVIFVMHGIRDYGQWTHQVKKRADAIAKEHGLKIQVITPRYKRFSLLDFLCPMSRQRKVRWFLDEYTEAYARFPKARFHFIGHSYGTYLLAEALKQYAACRFDRVVFTGSVVPRRYPWDSMIHTVEARKRVEVLRNDLASDDWVVATFPRFFEQVWELTHINLADLGAGGVLGFEEAAGNQHEIAYVKGQHSAAIEPACQDSLVRFVLGFDEESKIDDPKLQTGELSKRVKRLSTFCIPLVLTMAAIPLVLLTLAMLLWHYFATGAFGVNPAFGWICGLGFPWYPATIPVLLTIGFVWYLLSVA